MSNSMTNISMLPRNDRKWDVFISHASEDLELAENLCGELERSGWKSFLAARDLSSEIGSSDWSERIDEALDKSGVLVLVTSPESLSKKWVTYEWRSFHDDILSDRGGWIIPCCVREIGPSQLGRALRRYQIVDLRESDKWDKQIGSIVDLIEGYLKQPIDYSPPRKVKPENVSMKWSSNLGRRFRGVPIDLLCFCWR